MSTGGLISVITASADTDGETSPVQTVPDANPDPTKVCVMTQCTGATGGTSPTVKTEVQWSLDGTNFGPADTADILATGAANGAARLGVYTIKAPYWRAVTTFTGTPTNMTYNVKARYLATGA